MGFFETNVEKMKEKGDIKGLIKALTNKDIIVQVEAAEALGEIKDARAVEPLIKALFGVGLPRRVTSHAHSTPFFCGPCWDCFKNQQDFCPGGPRLATWCSAGFNTSKVLPNARELVF